MNWRRCLAGNALTRPRVTILTSAISFEQEVEKQKQVLTVEVEKRMSSDGTKPLAQSLIEVPLLC